ncbi:phosphocarrier protein Chr [Gracilibacillus halophilus YIM-C55.5]|uniref:Phosphocarrier protein Chr n=1 Tax=Gracilibacillus halophilus YIM-C55.5 TaxID=1308866 RepID=N4WIN4_9BACI|nr:HPr family phosphocarrier protein [Gracilibacillus halophilus]ENH96012.1 phosphocarrier protein Chr [Gracilibacillus halophilus YIM-C55.5]
MVSKEVEIALHPGLQARPAAEFVQKANRFVSHIFIEQGEKRINGKSIMGLMSLALSKGDHITIIADGTDEETAIDELVGFVTEKEE